MKVYELLMESNIKHVRVKTLPNLRGRDEKPNKLMGTGTSAQVFAGGDANTVVKEIGNYEKPDNDPHYHYIDMVMSHQDNPFFPKIYSAKVYEVVGVEGNMYNNDEATMVVQMEKLTSFDSTKTQHLLPQLLKQFGISINDMDDNEAFINAANMSDVERSHNANQAQGADANDNLGKILSTKFRTAGGRQELMNSTTNPQLRQALSLTHDIIEKLKHDKERPTTGDLHHENIMVRLTSHGPQLVIVDPITAWWE